MPRRPSLSALLVCLAVAALMAPALVWAASSPTKGGSYVGEVSANATRTDKRVVVKVSNDGKTARARLACTDTRASLSPKFPISKGKFDGRKTFGGDDLLWRLKGTFKSKTKIKGKLYLPAICDGRGGKITLLLDE